jgi:hypothetical protein
MAKVFDEVVCIDDVLDQGLPVGEVGVITQIETHPEKALKFLVRFPQVGYTTWCTGRDLISYKHYVRARIEKELLYSLAHTKSLVEQDQIFVMQEEEQTHFASMSWGWTETEEDSPEYDDEEEDYEFEDDEFDD